MQTLAKKLGITYQALHASIGGNPTLDRLQKIAEVLGVPVLELLEEPRSVHSFTCPHHCGASFTIDISMTKPPKRKEKDYGQDEK